MNTIIKFLKFQDIFESTFRYFFNKKRTQHTILTVLLSFAINTFVIIVFIIELYELLEHTNPDVNYAKMRNTIAPNLTLNTKELLFSIGIRDKNYNFVNDPSIATIKATYEIVISDKGKLNQTIKTLPFMNCTNIRNIYEKEGIAKYFESNSVEQYSCFNYTSPIIIGGKYATSFYGNLAFYIIKCRNETNINCKTEEEINDSLQNGWLQIVYMTSYVDYYNYTHPIQYITKGPYAKLDVLMNKLTYIYFSQIKTETDNGWIFSSLSNIYSTEVDYTDNDINQVKNDGIIASVYVCPSVSLELFYRKYKKIQQIAASIGGIFSSLTIFSSVVINFFSTYLFDVTFSNSIFNFCFENPFKSTFIFQRIHPNDLEKFSLDSRKIEQNNVTDNSKTKIKMIKQVNTFKLDYFSSNFKKLGKMKTKIIYEMKLSLKHLFRLVFDAFTLKGKTLKKEYEIIKKQVMIYADFINIGKTVIDVEKMQKVLIKHFPKEKSLNGTKKILFLKNIDENSDMKGIIFSRYSLNNCLEYNNYFKFI